jgi:adenosylcobinamide kinase/adenosylcobinamide-phosphate guanylyltransferase
VITLILGGARSGKSAVAEGLAAKGEGAVTYVATLQVGDDTDLGERVAQHQRRRPAKWTTLECPTDLSGTLSQIAGTMLIDSLGPWISSRPNMDFDPADFCDALRRRRGDTIVVSEEVGMGVHPETPLGRQFRDALGLANQAVAREADVVLLVVAGRALTLSRGDIA